MANSSRFSFGDVVLVPFPFTDQSGTKKRPDVVISSHGYNASRLDIVIMAITGVAGVKSCHLPACFRCEASRAAQSVASQWQLARPDPGPLLMP